MFLDQEQIIKDAGHDFAQSVAEISIKLWKNHQFRKLVAFSQISPLEKDRIFNELEVSFLGLFTLYIDNMIIQLDEDKEKIFLSKLQTALIHGFLQIYKDLKLEKSYIEDWEMLIDIRLKEYRKDFKLLLKEARVLKESGKNSSFKMIWARIETITLDSLSHIRKGNLDQKDPLRKFLQENFLMVDKSFGRALGKLIFNPRGRA